MPPFASSGARRQAITRDASPQCPAGHSAMADTRPFPDVREGMSARYSSPSIQASRSRVRSAAPQVESCPNRAAILQGSVEPACDRANAHLQTAYRSRHKSSRDTTSSTRCERDTLSELYRGLPDTPGRNSPSMANASSFLCECRGYPRPRLTRHVSRQPQTIAGLPVSGQVTILVP